MCPTRRTRAPRGGKHQADSAAPPASVLEPLVRCDGVKRPTFARKTEVEVKENFWRVEKDRQPAITGPDDEAIKLEVILAGFDRKSLKVEAQVDEVLVGAAPGKDEQLAFPWAPGAVAKVEPCGGGEEMAIFSFSKNQAFKSQFLHLEQKTQAQRKKDGQRMGKGGRARGSVTLRVKFILKHLDGEVDGEVYDQIKSNEFRAVSGHDPDERCEKPKPKKKKVVSQKQVCLLPEIIREGGCFVGQGVGQGG